MSLTIGSSISYRIASNITKYYNKLGANISHISSGLRASGPGEDIVTLSASNMIKSDISVLSQGIRNANDGMSLLQVADGASQVIGIMLIRLKELAEQASTGTYSDDLRKIIDEEFQQIMQEISLTANSCEFNSIKILNDDNISIKIHYGMENSDLKDYLHIRGQDFTAAGLKIDTLSVLLQDDAQKALEDIDKAIITVNENRAHFGALINRLEEITLTQGGNIELIYGHSSAIGDTDIANEFTDLTTNTVKAQTALAALSKANMTPHKALSILSGQNG